MTLENMTPAKKNLPGWIKALRNVTMITVLVWAGFWFIFTIVSMLGTSGNGLMTTGGLAASAVALVLLAAGAVIPWVFRLTGAILLIGEGVFLFTFFAILSRNNPNVLVLLLISLPPLVGGGLHLADWFLVNRFSPSR